jgi:pimeloyl-ACP methyl ester carboxylesterase
VLLVADFTPERVTDRDGKQAGHRPLLVLADALTRRGIATLRFDARRSPLEALTYEARAADVLAAYKYLQARPGIDGKKTGLLGWGAGGNVASMVAAGQPDVAFLTLMATPGVNAQDLMAQQVLSMPEIKDQAVRQIEIMADLVDIIETEEDLAAREKQVRVVLETEGRKQLQIKDEVKDAPKIKLLNYLVNTQTKLFASAYFRSFLRHSPRQTMAKVRCPVLAITGERSIYAPPKENLGAIHEALQEGGNKDVTVQELPNLNYQFQTSQGGGMLEAGKIKETIAPSVLQLVGDWLEKQTAAK